LVDVALDEGAVGAHLLPAFADLVEGPADQCGTDAAALEGVLDHGVREDQHVGVGGVGLVFGVARDDAGVVDRLVARLLGVVLDGDVGAFTHGPTVPVPGSRQARPTGLGSTDGTGFDGRDWARRRERPQRTWTTSLPSARRASKSSSACPKPSRAYVAPIGGSMTPASIIGTRSAHWECMKPGRAIA